MTKEEIKKYILNNKLDLSKKELVTFLVQNFREKDMLTEQIKIKLTGLDFSKYDVCVDISEMKVFGDLVQEYHEVRGNLYQGFHEVKGDLYQFYQNVRGDILQNHQEVEGKIYQDILKEDNE